MTLAEAVEKNICRVRDNIWACPEDYLKINITEVNGKRCYGPWLKLYARKSQEAIGEPTPQTISVFIGDIRTCDDIVEYTGPIDKEDQ